MIQVQPLKIMSMPTNRPMTQKPLTGHCCQIMRPRTRLSTPPKKIQPQWGNRCKSEPTMRNTPLTINEQARSERQCFERGDRPVQEQETHDHVEQAHQEHEEEPAPVARPEGTDKLSDAARHEQDAQGQGRGQRGDERCTDGQGAHHDQDNPQRQEPRPLAADDLQLVTKDSPSIAKI